MIDFFQYLIATPTSRVTLSHAQRLPPFTLLHTLSSSQAPVRPPHTALPSTTVNLEPRSLPSQDITIQLSNYSCISRNSLH